MPSPGPSVDLMEEGTSSPFTGMSARFVQRRTFPERMAARAGSHLPFDHPPSALPSSALLSSSASSPRHPTSSSSWCASLCHHPYVPLLTTLLLFVLFLATTSYSFVYLRTEHPVHQFSLSPPSSELLSSHPAYVALTRQLTAQYQALMTLARTRMTEAQWQDFQAEAATLDLTPKRDADAAAISCPACPACGDGVRARGRLAELSAAEMMTDWSVNSTAPLLPSDLSLQPAFDWRALEHAWTYCDRAKVAVPFLGVVELCDPSDFRLEQTFEKAQFVIPAQRGAPVDKPHAPDCIWAPPAEFSFPSKHLSLPASVNSTWVRWENHLVLSAANLSLFNYGYGKNLYHFDAPFYDREQLAKLDRVAAHIPFAAKVRNGLDIGAGGGSLSLLLHRRYNTVVLNLVYAELPYCEYITERGGLCAYITAFWSMPFAKFSFDFVHIAWLFHMYSGYGLIEKLMEVHRVLRPGGYLWWEGGFSYAQRDSVKDWATSLGYALVWEESKDAFDGTMFGSEKHQCDYIAVFRKASKGRIECKG